MKFIKTFEKYNNHKFYDYVSLEEDSVYYQIPFNYLDSGKCFKNNDDYLLCLNGSKFYYDELITDDDINNALKLDLQDIDISKDWSQTTKTTFAFEKINIHTLRCAKLVEEIQKNISINPIHFWFDEYSFKYVKNYIEDGNHRIRALKYLKYDGFPAYVYGSHSKYLIEDLIL